jgi:hypothetical protein
MSINNKLPLESALDDLQRSARERPYPPRGEDIKERPAATVTQGRAPSERMPTVDSHLPAGIVRLFDGAVSISSILCPIPRV